MIADPPVFAGAVKEMESWPPPTVAVPMVGAPGADAVEPFAAAENAPVPIAFFPATRHE